MRTERKKEIWADDFSSLCCEFLAVMLVCLFVLFLPINRKSLHLRAALSLALSLLLILLLSLALNPALDLPALLLLHPRRSPHLQQLQQ